MPKKILLIETDQELAGRLSESLELSGFTARVAGDGKDGLDLARDWAPDAIVLCVELPSMSGYLVCQKLRKDDLLKSIPLVLTSAEATQDTFEKHRALKARADAYLLKPYEPEALVEELGALVGMPEGPPRPVGAVDEPEEELVTLDTDVSLGAGGEPDAEVPALSLESLDEPVAAAAGSALDDDLRLLDDAFAEIAVPTAADAAAAALDDLTGEAPLGGGDVDGLVAAMPGEDEGPARTDVHPLEDEAETALGVLAEADETLSPGLPIDDAVAEPPRAAPSQSIRGASADLLRAAGIKLLDDERPAALVPPPDLEQGDARAAEPPREPSDALARATADLAARDRELRDLRRDLEAARDQARKAESDAKVGREEARRAAEQARTAEAELPDLRRKLAEAEKRAASAEQEARRKGEEMKGAAEAIRRVEALEREAEDLRTELLVARGEADGARGEIERRTAELRKRVADLEATNAKNEERVVKAYQKIKADEKVRDKVRKALAIASQLLDEGLPAESPAEKERRAAGRD